jgi:hypothetical protein
MPDLGWDAESIRQKIMEQEIQRDERKLAQRRLELEIARKKQSILDHEAQIVTLNGQLEQDAEHLAGLQARLETESGAK